MGGSRPSYSRQASRDSVQGSASTNLPSRRPHTSVPGPEEDEMAPQNVSFIDSSAEDNADDETAGVDSASKRLSQLNITSGSKTYRVVHTNASNSSGGEKESSPSPTRQRPTLSSAFKQSRRGSSGEHSGPSSLRSNSGVGLTEEEAEMLAAIKTEKLKDNADASKGFVISFDSDTPKKRAQTSTENQEESDEDNELRQRQVILEKIRLPITIKDD